MKLRNKKTGEIVVFVGTYMHDDRVFLRLKDERGIFKREINSLAELNAEWKDYEESKGYFEPALIDNNIVALIVDKKTSREEAEKAVEKLKAWKRLKDKGFEFEWVDKDIGSIKFAFFNREGKITKEMWQDIDLLFGGD